MNKVEMYKIGTILGGFGGKIATMMIVSNAGEPCDTYVKILREHCSEEYSFLKTDKAIIGKLSMKSHVYDGYSITGALHEPPKVGESLMIGSIRTSIVDRVIEDCIVITKNSVYAIHNPALIREKKLNDLGI
jgi:hypothetical protein